MSTIAGTSATARMLARAGTPLTLSAVAGTPPTVVPAKPRKLAASRTPAAEGTSKKIC
jgi:hypothetical protein